MSERGKHLEQCGETINRLEAHVEALEGALREIAVGTKAQARPEGSRVTFVEPFTVGDLRSIARAALAGETVP